LAVTLEDFIVDIDKRRNKATGGETRAVLRGVSVPFPADSTVCAFIETTFSIEVGHPNRYLVVVDLRLVVRNAEIIDKAISGQAPRS
jgi:hypothetical protein